MVIQLTDPQLRDLDASGSHRPRVRDPRSDREYVLLTADEYVAFEALTREDEFQRAIRRVGSRNAANRAGDES